MNSDNIDSDDMLTDNQMYIIIGIGILLLVLVIIAMATSKAPPAPTGYFPLVTSGTGCAAIVQPTATYAVPNGFTYFGNWAFNPSKKLSTTVISNSNKTATFSSADILESDTALPDTTGNYMYSISLSYNSANAPETNGVGLGSNAFVPNISKYPGYDNTAIGIYDDGSVWFDNSTPSTDASDANYSGGSVMHGRTGNLPNIIDVAVDLRHKRIWYRVDNGNWNNDSRADPSTNKGGCNFRHMVGKK
jgi:hypothetical protein